MSPPRRRSARLATGTTPKSSKVATHLSAVDEDYGAPDSDSHTLEDGQDSPSLPKTPSSSPLKPTHGEMHPSKVHVSTAEPSSASRFGFTSFKSSEKGRKESALPETPSKATVVPSTSFSFNLPGAASERLETSGVERIQGLSSDAKRIMDELHEKAAKFKADLVAQREAEMDSCDFGDRLIAKPKGKSGRYSAAHMAEFKKMDSIENHASAWRASRFTPTKASLKRSPSKADLDGTPTKSSLFRSPSRTKSEQVAQTPKRGLKRTSSVANLDGRPGSASPTKVEHPSSIAAERTPLAQSSYSIKRVKQDRNDDTSNNRLKRPDASPISVQRSKPRTQSSFARLMSPTKASKAHTLTPSKATITMIGNNSPAVATGQNQCDQKMIVASPSKTDMLKRRILSPTRVQKVKSILRGPPSEEADARSAIPQPTLHVSQTPAPRRVDKELPPLPLTTPRRKLSKKVTFTPDTKRAALSQNSPSPFKMGILKFRGFAESSMKQFSGIDSVLAEKKSGEVAYPDLSAFNDLIASSDDKPSTPTVPGTFSFRADHTIQFRDTSETGFGASPGQSSVRQVRSSVNPTSGMPGSFPAPPPASTHPDKENKAPSPVKGFQGIAHGLSNKKRHRASSDEGDIAEDNAERATKKRKNEHSGQAHKSPAPRPVGSTPTTSAKRVRLDRAPSQTPSKTPTRTPSRTPSSASPTKKQGVLSMSRLNMLSRPKNRV